MVDRSREVLHFAGNDFAPCLLSDLSTDGAGLTLAEGQLAVGDHVELALQLGAGRRARIKLRGEIRHISPAHDGSPRAGLEFVEVGDLERALLVRLVRDIGHRPTRRPA